MKLTNEQLHTLRHMLGINTPYDREPRDLAGRHEVYEALEAMARREYRPVEEQAAWMLKQALEAEGLLLGEADAVR